MIFLLNVHAHLDCVYKETRSRARVCVCVCVFACMLACLRAGVCVGGGGVGVCVCARKLARMYPCMCVHTRVLVSACLYK